MVLRSLTKSIGLSCLITACGNFDGLRTLDTIMFCGGEDTQRIIKYDSDRAPEEHIVVWISEEHKLTKEVIEREERGITAYSWFGSNQSVPNGFVKALLLNNGEEMLVFKDANKSWLEYGGHVYPQCE